MSKQTWAERKAAIQRQQGEAIAQLLEEDRDDLAKYAKDTDAAVGLAIICARYATPVALRDIEPTEGSAP